MQFDGCRLEGRWVRLEPLAAAHGADLMACADATCFQYAHDEPRGSAGSWDEGAFFAYIERAMVMPGRVALAVIELASGRAVGTTSYADIQAAHRGVEIGFTWLAPAARGTRVNPEMKLLMLGHAFEAQGAERVQLKCDARNVQSQRAITKLGAVREGVLRRHRVLPDGFVRDTVMYSVIRPEWPRVKAGLEERLSAG